MRSWGIGPSVAGQKRRRRRCGLRSVSWRSTWGSSRSLTTLSSFLAKSRNIRGRALVFAGRVAYLAPRRGTESQRARPPRCEAAPPKSRLSRKVRPAKGSSSDAGPRHFRSRHDQAGSAFEGGGAGVAEGLVAFADGLLEAGLGGALLERVALLGVA